MPLTSSSPLIVGYVPDHADRAQLIGALRGWARAHWVESVDDVVPAARRARGGPVTIILALRERDGRAAAAAVRALRRLTRCVAVVAHCRTGLAYAAGIRQMAEAGVHEFLFVGVDDTPASLRALVASAHLACAADRVLASLLPVLPPAAHPVAHYCVTHPAQARSVRAVAGALGVHRKTLLNRCVAAGTPAPGALIVWCRLMLAAELLVATGQTVERVAAELDFPSDTALRNAMKRYTGLRANDVRLRGGLACVVDAFSGRLRRSPPCDPCGAGLP